MFRLGFQIIFALERSRPYVRSGIGPSPLARYLCHSETNLSQLSAAGAALSLVSAAEAETVTAKVRGPSSQPNYGLKSST